MVRRNVNIRQFPVLSVQLRCFLLRTENRELRTSLWDARRSIAGYCSCIFRAIAVTIRRGVKRTDCANSQFLNPEITTGFPGHQRAITVFGNRARVHRTELQQPLAGCLRALVELRGRRHPGTGRLR